MNDTKEKTFNFSDMSKLSQQVTSSRKETLGVINQDFLLQSIGTMLRKEPVCIDQDCVVNDAVKQILDKKSGSALVLDENSKVVGIFTERDYLKNFALGIKDPATTLLKEVSTLNPVLVTPDTTFAHALNLMSLGGFRHLPVVDSEGLALGVVSVRDVIDKISDALVNDLLNFENL